MPPLVQATNTYTTTTTCMPPPEGVPNAPLACHMACIVAMHDARSSMRLDSCHKLRAPPGSMPDSAAQHAARTWSDHAPGAPATITTTAKTVPRPCTTGNACTCLHTPPCHAVSITRHVVGPADEHSIQQRQVVVMVVVAVVACGLEHKLCGAQ
jgi:hypothetical protein